MKRRDANGFTLVEVLVALVIVAIGMSVLFSAMGSSAETAAYLRDKSFAQWIALNQLAQTRLAASPPSIGKTEGELDYGGRHWAWQQEVTQQDIPGLLRIDVSVQPTEPNTKPQEGHWLATISGVIGDAVASPRFDPLYPDYRPPGAAGTPGAPGSTPANPTIPANPAIPAPVNLSGTPTPAPAPAPAPPPSGTP